MLRNLIIYIARKKNPAFKLEEKISSGVLISLALQKSIALLRGLRLFFALRKPCWLFLGSGVKMVGLHDIHLGKFVQIGDHACLWGFGRKGLYIGNNVWIGSHSSVKVSFSFNDLGDYIKIGNNVGIGEFAHLGGAGGLEIGDDCIIGPYLSCHPENHNFSDSNTPIRLQGVSRKGIKIGNNCWIGSKVTILDGVTIGDNCIIAAGAVVNKNIPANSIIGGVPARIIKQRDDFSMSKVA